MSLNCGTRHPPILSNYCTGDPIGSGDTVNYVLQNFCTAEFNDDVRRNFCSQIGGGNEWEFGQRTTFGDCQVLWSDINDGVSIDKFGCCHFDCTGFGSGTTCNRTAYNGNKLNCCFRDLAYNSLTQYCYDNNNGQNTCDPNYRDITSTSCQDDVLNYCVGNAVPDSGIAALDLSNPADLATLNSRWTEAISNPNSIPDCIYAMNRNLFTNPETPGLTSSVPINPSLFTNRNGFIWATNLMNTLFTNYIQAGYQIGAIPGFPGYDSVGFQTNILFPICSTIPGLCVSSLNNICGATTTNDLLQDPALVPWCGCYMNNLEYQTYVDNFQINKECTPTCARQGNIPLANTSGYGVTLCNQTVCLIDDVTINLEQTQVGGDINFAQFCSACSGGVAVGTTTSSSTFNTSSSSCQCIINGFTLDAANSAIGGNVDLEQVCGPSTICYIKNPNGSNPPLIQAPCDAGPNYNPNNDPIVIARKAAEQAARERTLIIIFLVIISIIIIIVLLYLFS